MNGRPVVWITGASSGIGLAVAMRLAGSGWPVAMSARNAETLEAARASITGTTFAVPADVTDAETLSRAAAEIANAWNDETGFWPGAGADFPTAERSMSGSSRICTAPDRTVKYRHSAASTGTTR